MSNNSILLLSTTAAMDGIRSFTFGTMDYIVFVLLLCVSLAIGVYFGFFSKSQNTTDEYLMGGKNMKSLPIAISLVASQLSGVSIMSVPVENYNYGIMHIFFIAAVAVVIPFLCWVVVPVFYENNISNCYQYLEMRFNKRTRQIVTVSFVINSVLALPVLIFLPSLAFSQVTGVNIHLINGIVCAICVFYTMVGGIKAVVWTDVVQAGIMVGSVVFIAILSTIKTGGVGKVFEISRAGGRLDLNFSLDPRVRTTVINSFVGGIGMWFGHIGFNQSCVQRIVSLPSLRHAKKSLLMAMVGIILILVLNSYNGYAMFARYFDCDPIKAGFVHKFDQMVPYFVQDIMGHLNGMPGVFISCVFSAALSTMSATLNSLAGVIYFDYIKPFIRHSDARANYIMKICVVFMGVWCVFAGFIVEKFDSILQIFLTLMSITAGAIIGVYLLGMFVPRANGKVAVYSIIIAVLIMVWIIVNAQIAASKGYIKYNTLPTSTAGCKAYDMESILKSYSTTTPVTLPNDKMRVTTAFGSDRDFSLYEVSFYWYQLMGAALVWIIAIPLSYVWKRDEDERQDPKLYCSLVRKFLKLDDQISVEDESLRALQPLKAKVQIIVKEN